MIFYTIYESLHKFSFFADLDGVGGTSEPTFCRLCSTELSVQLPDNLGPFGLLVANSFMSLWFSFLALQPPRNQDFLGSKSGELESGLED